MVFSESPLTRETLPAAESLPEMHDGANQTELYRHTTFNEGDNPEYAERMWGIHAESYRAFRFVTDAAIEGGILASDLDKSRGRPNNQYYHGQNPKDPNDEATMRIVHLKQGEAAEDLPGFGVTKESMMASNLIGLVQNVDPANLVEIVAFARREKAEKRSLEEVLRRGIHDSIGKGQTWFFGVVRLTHGALVRDLGASNLPVLGKDVKIEHEMVTNRAVLRPSLLLPDRFFDRMLDDIDTLENGGNVPMAGHLREKFLFYSDGLAEEKMSDRVQTARKAFQETK